MSYVLLTRFSKLPLVSIFCNDKCTRYLLVINRGMIFLERTDKWCNQGVHKNPYLRPLRFG